MMMQFLVLEQISDEELIAIQGNRDDPAGFNGGGIFILLPSPYPDPTALLEGATDYWSTTYNPYSETASNDCGASGNNSTSSNNNGGNDCGASMPK